MDSHRLDLAIGAEEAAALIQSHADEIAHQDRLDARTALRLACERAADGDPLALAAPGQVWHLRDDVDIDDAPARALTVHARLSCPARVLVVDPADTTGEVDELLLEVLDLYRIASSHTDPITQT